MILYLHGFRSSPYSFKARLIAARLQEQGRSAAFCCPQLPASPRDAVTLAADAASRYPVEELVLIGSSLGGYYATWLAEQLGCRAVLLNPAVNPSGVLEKYVGVPMLNYANAPFEFKPAYVDELKEYAVDRLTRPERYFLIAATGDEVLDWKEMVTQYSGARQCVIEGGDHGLSGFEQYVEEVLDFCHAPWSASR